MPANQVRLFNSISRRKETLEPIEPPRVGIYACGPTVYDVPHLGNFRYFVWVDVLRRYLDWRGFDVHLVMNITDVEDRTIAGANRDGISLRQYTDRYADAFQEGLRSLRIRPASCYPRATEHIGEMIQLIERLIERGHAYAADGSVYFRVDSFPQYGALARLDPDEMRSTARVEGDEFSKHDGRDFALWKAAKEGEPFWDSPFGRGRPGWHLECSAMSMKYLGSTFDMHLGGVDLLFPHHENEIAQSVGATGEPLARMWVHCSHLLIDNTKMSKSLGNFHSVRELLDQGHQAETIRYLLASVHYRRQLNFTREALEQAAAAVERLREFVERLQQGTDAIADQPSDEVASRLLTVARDRVVRALDDDLNTAGALGHIFTLVRDANSALDRSEIGPGGAGRILAWLRDIDEILAVLPDTGNRVELTFEHAGRTLSAQGPRLRQKLVDLVEGRLRARADGDYAAADQLREQLLEAGVEIEDTPEGARWHQRRPRA